MSGKEYLNPLVAVYGENAIDLAFEEIKRLQKNSNIPFDDEYVKLGASFTTINANKILENKKPHCSLVSLVRESFGEAAVYKYNC